MIKEKFTDRAIISSFKPSQKYAIVKKLQELIGILPLTRWLGKETSIFNRYTSWICKKKFNLLKYFIHYRLCRNGFLCNLKINLKFKNLLKIYIYKFNLIKNLNILNWSCTRFNMFHNIQNIHFNLSESIYSSKCFNLNDGIKVNNS